MDICYIINTTYIYYSFQNKHIFVYIIIIIISYFQKIAQRTHTSNPQPVRLALALWPVALGISPWESPAPARGPQPGGTGGTGGTGIRSLLVSILSMVNLRYLRKKTSILYHFSWFGLTLRADTIVCPRNQRPQHVHVLLSFRLQGWGVIVPQHYMPDFSP